MTKKHAIAVSLNRSYLKFALLYFKSLQKNYPDYPTILIHHTDLDEPSIAHLAKYPRIKFMRQSLSQNEMGPAMLNSAFLTDLTVYYSRFKLWSTQYDEYDNILQMDLDMLVLKPLDALLSRSEFTIFQDCFQGKDKIFYDPDNPQLLKLLKEDGLHVPDIAGNAGICLIPKKYRHEANYQYLIYLTHRYAPYITWADQSIINLWLNKNGIVPCSEHRYNYQIKQAMRDPISKGYLSKVAVIHFSGWWNRLGQRYFFMKTALILSKNRGLWMIYLCIHKIYYNLREWKMKLATA